MTLTLLIKILALALALVVVAILKVLIAILTLLVFILTLVVVPGICLWGIIVFTPGVQTTVSPNVFSMNRALFLGTRVLLRWFGLFGCLLELLALLLRILRLLVFAFVGFGNFLLPQASERPKTSSFFRRSVRFQCPP